MKQGGTGIYKQPLTLWGANEEQPQTPQVSQGVAELLQNISDIKIYAVFEGRLHRAGNNSMQIVIEAC